MRNIFSKDFTILDGGMGQELLARGVKPISNLWSATALMETKYHQIVKDCHIDFIKAGSEMILTNTFGSRRRRLEDNQIEHRFEELNYTALKLARESVKETKRKVLIAGSLPPQNFTYLPELGDLDKMKKNFFDQAKILNEGVDLFYLDVLSSLAEIEIGIQSIQTFNKPFVVGIHFKKNGLLPSGEKIKDVINKIKSHNPLAITGSCVAYEDVVEAKNSFIESGLPFGFKINAFKEIPKGWKPDSSNPNLVLGKNEDLTTFKFKEISKEFIDMGAKLLGGCCEITPLHISKLLDLR